MVSPKGYASSKPSKLERIRPKLDISKERIGRRLDLASTIAEQDRNAQAIVASELGIAKVFHRLDAPQDTKP